MVTIKNRPRQESQFIDVFDEDQIQKAIVYRKAKYDEGAEKVQSQINQLSQLPSLTPEHDKYIQDKISSLTSNINSIAGLDLSNQYNVNKVSSMSSEIVDDPIIQGAVSSARNHQKQMKYMEDAKQNPKKYGDVIKVQNEDDYYNKLSKYKQDIAAGNEFVFSYTYKPYTDVEGLISKRAEKIKADVVMGRAGDYFTKDEVITPDKIRKLAYGMIEAEPSYKDQIRINSNFSTKNISDEQLLTQKNRIQINELRDKDQRLQREIINLYNVDLGNPKETAKLIGQYKDKMKKYQDYAKDLQANPNKLIDTETGQVDNTRYNRQQLAYEISAYSIGDNLVSSFSRNNRILSANPMPFKRDELDWNKRMADIDNQFKVREEIRQDEALSLKRQELALVVKDKLKIDGDGAVSYDSAENVGAIADDPEPLINNMIGEQKLATQNLLKGLITDKLRTIQGLSNGGNDQHYLDKFVDSMLTPEGRINNFKDQITIRRMQAYGKASSGITPDAKLLQEGLKYVHALKKDVDNIWNNDKVMSPENVRGLQQYTDNVHQIATMQAASKFANDAGARSAGFENKQAYDKFFKDNNKKRTVEFYTQGGEYHTREEDDTSSEAKSKIDAYNKGKADYYTKRIASAKLYPVVNFDQKDPKTYTNVKADFSRAIKDGVGADVTGKVSVGGIYGKVDKWSNLPLSTSAEIDIIDYNPKSGIVRTRVKDGSGKETTEGEYKFYVNPTRVQRHIPENVREGLKPTDYDDALNFSNNGKLEIKVNRRVTNPQTGITSMQPVYEDAWKVLDNNLAPLTWKAEKVEPKSVENRQVRVYLQLPVEGQKIPMKINQVFPSAEDAKNALKDLSDRKVKQLQDSGLQPQQVKQELLKYLQRLNGGI